jgi:carbamoyl-phosphate synthase small subunit
VTTPAVLALEDGTVFRGISIGAAGTATGEVVFNTAMTGYQEILTDPSYSRQIVTLTYPHIGNTGTNPEDLESGAIHAAGLVIRDLPLTRILREKGAQAGCIASGDAASRPQLAVEAARRFPGLKGMDLAKVVSTRRPFQWNEGTNWALGQGPRRRPGQRLHVVAYDFGIKRNILRLLADHGCRMTVVPAQTPAEEALALTPDGVFLSNGPGDPEPCDYAIEAIGRFLEARLPVFGICLGHQLLGLASGARTVKMKFGHHGANHPVIELDTGRVFISSQNHGFAVDEATLPATVRPTHRSLFDGSLQGIACMDRPAYGFQGHPEASPGPRDLAPLFAQFVESMLRKGAMPQRRLV